MQFRVVLPGLLRGHFSTKWHWTFHGLLAQQLESWAEQCPGMSVVSHQGVGRWCSISILWLGAAGRRLIFVAKDTGKQDCRRWKEDGYCSTISLSITQYKQIIGIMTCQSPTALSNNSITFDGTDTSVFWWCSRLLFFYYLGRISVTNNAYVHWVPLHVMQCLLLQLCPVLSVLFQSHSSSRASQNLGVLWECPIASPSQSCWEPQ